MGQAALFSHNSQQAEVENLIMFCCRIMTLKLKTEGLGCCELIFTRELSEDSVLRGLGGVGIEEIPH